MTIPPGTQDRARRALDALATCQTVDDRTAGLLSNPVLLRLDVVTWLAEQSLPDDLMDLVAAIDHYRATVTPHDYVIGLGPVERLWQRVLEGELGVEEAMVAARQVTVTESLWSVYVHALFTELEEAPWRTSRDLGSVLLAALDACDRRDETPLRIARLAPAVHWAKRLLVHVPEVDLLRRADELGHQALAMGQELGDATLVRQAAFALGALWGDPYVYGRTPSSYELQQRTWFRRAELELGERDGLPASAWAMPPATEALRTSLRYWWQALEASPDDPSILIAIVEAGTLLAAISDEPVDPRVEDAQRRGLELTAEGTEHDDAVLRQRFLARAPDQSHELDLLTPPSDELVRRYGGEAAGMVARIVLAEAERDPATALDALVRHQSLVLDSDLSLDAVLRLARLRCRLVDQLHGSQDPDAVDGDELLAEPAATAQRVLDRCPDDRAGARALVWLAWVAADQDGELVSMQLMKHARELDPGLGDELDRVDALIDGMLLEHEGANQMAADRVDHDMALLCYCRAIGPWVHAGRPDAVERTLDKIADIVHRAGPQAWPVVLATCADRAADIARCLGRDGDRLVAETVGGLLGGMVAGQQANGDLVWVGLQLNRGLRTAMEIQAPPLDLPHDAVAADLLERLDADHRAGLRRPGADLAGRASLRRALEGRRDALLSRTFAVPLYGGLESVWRELDGRTAVLARSLLHSRHRPGRWLSVLTWPGSGTIGLYGDDDEDVARDGAALERALADLHAEGYDHLCLIGELPWAHVPALRSAHLYPYRDGVLADDWLVTSLPHPQLLRGDPVDGGRADRDVRAFALDFADDPRGDPLPDTIPEAETIAAVTGGRASVGDEATETALRQAVATATHLHLATHGRFLDDTPSFSQVLLQPDDEHDGALCAWEVAELDLSRVSLVTLSACESARSVTDDYGNQGGLPTAFLRAGASTVVGTLWDIETRCSRLFFETLYGHLAADAAVGSAFRQAQLAVRERFPEPRDWAAFYLSGRWS